MKLLLEQTQAYLDYIKEHYDNVQKAWKELQEKCKDMRFVYDDFVWGTINQEIKDHDVSKLSKEEFVPYRRKFFPTDRETKSIHPETIRTAFELAWEHHKDHNMHHWQTWTGYDFADPYSAEIHCVHMVADWMAMGYKFGDTAKSYYEENKETIELPEWAVKFIYEIFDRVYG